MNAHTLRVEGITNRELDETLKSFWELESLGIERVSNDPASDHFSSTLQKMEGTRCLFRGAGSTTTFQIITT